MKFGRKQLVLAALVLALGAAVYLTWQLSGPEVLPVGNEPQETSELGAAQLVNNAYIETVGDDLQKTGKATTEVSAGIAEARMSRQASRDEAMEILNGILAEGDENTEEVQQASTQASAIAQNIMEESNVENLLSAKGYGECVAYINNGDCNVVVAQELTAADSIVIQEIVVGQTGLTADKIKIISTQ